MALSEKAALSKDKATGADVELQHRHFAFIAAVIARMPSSEARFEATAAFAGALKHTNPNFDVDRFWRAAGFSASTNWDKLVNPKAADHIDGYDRDDLGESPDY